VNINPIIEFALSGLTLNAKSVPIFPIVCTDSTKPSTYVTYYTVLEKDSEYADDDAVETDTTGAVDIFCKGNYKSLLVDIKARLKIAGFTILSCGPEQYESNTGYYHVPIDIYMEDCNS
jgi:hypothetical protein